MFKNNYEVGDQVDTPMGSGTITDVPEDVNVRGMVLVKLAHFKDHDGDEFDFKTTMLRHIPCTANELFINGDERFDEV